MYTKSYAKNNYKTKDVKSLNVAVIGAGFAGITTAKHLLEEGHSVVVYEKYSDIGGVWCYGKDKGGVWKSAFATSSKPVTHFSDFPMPPEYPDFPNHKLVLNYLNNYVDHFGFREKIKTNCNVKKTYYEDNQWTVETDKGTHQTDHVVVCSGLHQFPSTPDFGGLSKFEGDVMHSNDYKEPNKYKGKRVLIVGSGESAMDIAVEISNIADKVIVSSRNGVNILPRYLEGLPIDSYFPTWKFWLPNFISDAIDIISYNMKFGGKNGHIIKEWEKEKGVPVRTYIVKSTYCLNKVYEGKVVPKRNIERFEKNSVTFKDGSKEQIDAVLFCTGYKSTFPFLPKEYTYDHSKLYLTIMDPNYKNISFVGLVRPNFGAIPPLAEMQSRLLAAILANRITLPSKTVMQKVAVRDTQKRRKWQKFNNQRLIHIHDYTQLLNHLGGILGCKPKILKQIKQPALFAALVTNTMPTNFRVSGPNAWEGAGQYIVENFRHNIGNYSYFSYQFFIGLIYAGIVTVSTLSLFLIASTFMS